MSFLNWSILKEVVPKSLFLRMIKPSYYLGTTQRTTGYPRASDSSVYYKQFPVGWLFYVPSNIDKILTKLRSIDANLQFEQIQNDMEYVYNTSARESTVNAAEPAVIASHVSELNEEVVHIATNRLKREQNSLKKYGRYMKNPNFMAANPQFLKRGKDRTIAMVAGSDNVPQGGNFISQTTAGTYDPPTIQPLTKYV